MRKRGQRLNIILVAEGAQDRAGNPITAEQVKRVSSPPRGLITPWHYFFRNVSWASVWISFWWQRAPRIVTEKRSPPVMSRTWVGNYFHSLCTCVFLRSASFPLLYSNAQPSYTNDRIAKKSRLLKWLLHGAMYSSAEIQKIVRRLIWSLCHLPTVVMSISTNRRRRYIRFSQSRGILYAPLRMSANRIEIRVKNLNIQLILLERIYIYCVGFLQSRPLLHYDSSCWPMKSSHSHIVRPIKSVVIYAICIVIQLYFLTHCWCRWPIGSLSLLILTNHSPSNILGVQSNPTFVSCSFVCI